MKSNSKLPLIALCLALAAFALTSCKTTKQDTHTMGHKSNTWPMANSEMPGYR